MPFNDHAYRLFLDRTLYLAAVQLQADRGLGKAFSVMLPLVEGFHVLGYLSDGDYDLYKSKYSIGLIEGNKSPTQIRREQTRAAECKSLNRHFGEVLAQWSTLKESSKRYHLKEAEKFKTLKNAKLVLELGVQEKEKLAVDP
jgi:hypothetical protein